MTSIKDEELFELYPELGTKKPRPGGSIIYQQKIDEEEKKKENSNACLERLSKQVRFATVLDETRWTNKEEIDESFVPNPLEDAKDLLSIAITTTMLLAAGRPDLITENHKNFTCEYFSCIKNENDQIPPNILAVLKQLCGDAWRTVRVTTRVSRMKDK